VRLGEHVREETSRDTKGNFVHSGLVFICPLCGNERASWNYREDRNWRKACALHVKDRHNEILEGCGLSKEEIERLHEMSLCRRGLAGGCSS
jgi:hypothetical protein